MFHSRKGCRHEWHVPDHREGRGLRADHLSHALPDGQSMPPRFKNAPRVHYSGRASAGGSGRNKPTISATTARLTAMIPAAVATCAGFRASPPAISGASRLVFKVAMLVPTMRPPTLVAKLPPVPRRCIGKTFGKYSPK